jgi:hypothetical protein
MLRNYPHLKRWEQTDDVFQRAALRLYRSLGEVQPASPREFFGLATTLQFHESTNGEQILSQIPTLEAENNLNLSVSDDAIRALKHIRTYQLGLHGQPRSVDTIRHISTIASVKDLNLQSTEVSDECRQFLSSMNLERIRLVGTKVTEAGVTALSKALPNCRIEWNGGVIESR